MLTGPERYELSVTPSAYTPDRKFSGYAAKKIPKLYVVLAEGRLVRGGHSPINEQQIPIRPLDGVLFYIRRPEFARRTSREPNHNVS